LIVIGKANLDEIEDGLSKAEGQLGRTINITFYSTREFREKIESKDSFIRTVLGNPKIMLIGEENEIKRP
jgi:hypothetical protein